MIFNFKKHSTDLYNILLTLSRNVFFYNKLKLLDSFETRVYLMFFHFSILMVIYKNKGEKLDQKSYDSLFFCVENDLRELGFGDVSVNKKMKDLNKILYDILLKIYNTKTNSIEIKENLVTKYFRPLNDVNDDYTKEFERYFINFYNFCFELPLKSMLLETKNFKYGCT